MEEEEEEEEEVRLAFLDEEEEEPRDVFEEEDPPPPLICTLRICSTRPSSSGASFNWTLATTGDVFGLTGFRFRRGKHHSLST